MAENGSVVIEPEARTTFENALLTGDIIQKEGFKKVLLVTSSYHMPRSLLLLKLKLNGSGTEIGVHKVSDSSKSAWAVSA